MATDQQELLCRQLKIRSRGKMEFQVKDHFIRKTPSCSWWCNSYVYVLRLLCQWFFDSHLANFRFVFFSLLFSGSA